MVYKIPTCDTAGAYHVLISKLLSEHKIDDAFKLPSASSFIPTYQEFCGLLNYSGNNENVYYAISNGYQRGYDDVPRDFSASIDFSRKANEIIKNKTINGEEKYLDDIWLLSWNEMLTAIGNVEKNTKNMVRLFRLGTNQCETGEEIRKIRYCNQFAGEWLKKNNIPCFNSPNC